MTRYELLQRLPSIISVPISTALATAVAKYLIDTQIAASALWVLVASIYLVIIWLVGELIKLTIASNENLRELILEGDFIEGVWSEELLTASRATGNPGVVADDIFVIIIRQNDGTYEVAAYIFDRNGNEKGYSISQFSKYQSGSLSYYFEGPWHEHSGVRTIQGFTKIAFARTSDRNPPRHFSGAVAEFGQEMSQVRFNGYKLPNNIRPESYQSLTQFALAVKEVRDQLKKG